MTKKIFSMFLSLTLLVILTACGAPNPKLAGNVSMTLKNYDQAVEEYKAALEQSPNSVSLLTGLGRAYYYLGQYDEAANAFKSATEIESYPEADLYFGLSKIMGGDRAAGLAELAQFRYPGGPHVTSSVNTMAALLADNQEATPKYIEQRMLQALKEGLRREREADRADK